MGDLKISSSQVEFYEKLCEASPREVGVELFFDKATGDHDKFRMLLGDEKTVPTWGTSAVFAHTHPINSKEPQRPPSSTDYYRALWDYFAGISWQIIFEQHGIWVYRPNAALVSVITAIDPNVCTHVTRRRQKITYRDGSVTYMLQDAGIDAINEKVLKNTAFDNEELRKSRITFSEYTESMGKCIDNKKTGFDVYFLQKGSEISLSVDEIPDRSPSGDPKSLFAEWTDDKVAMVPGTLTYSWISAQ